jgi:hypothetical protein
LWDLCALLRLVSFDNPALTVPILPFLCLLLIFATITSLAPFGFQSWFSFLGYD